MYVRTYVCIPSAKTTTPWFPDFGNLNIQLLHLKPRWGLLVRVLDSWLTMYRARFSCDQTRSRFSEHDVRVRSCFGKRVVDMGA